MIQAAYKKYISNTVNQLYFNIFFLIGKNIFQKSISNAGGGTSLMVQWLRLLTPNAGGPGSTPGQGTRSRMPQLKDPSCRN